MRKLLVAVVLVVSWVAAVSASELTLDKKTLSLEAAMRLAAKAAEEARARGVGVVIAVVDDGGHLIVLHRMDDAQVASVNVGIGKARTAAIYRRPNKDFEGQIRAGRVAALALADSTPLQGGVRSGSLARSSAPSASTAIPHRSTRRSPSWGRTPSSERSPRKTILRGLECAAGKDWPTMDAERE